MSPIKRFKKGWGTAVPRLTSSRPLAESTKMMAEDAALIRQHFYAFGFFMVVCSTQKNFLFFVGWGNSGEYNENALTKLFHTGDLTELPN